MRCDTVSYCCLLLAVIVAPVSGIRSTQQQNRRSLKWSTQDVYFNNGNEEENQLIPRIGPHEAGSGPDFDFEEITFHFEEEADDSEEEEIKSKREKEKKQKRNDKNKNQKNNNSNKNWNRDVDFQPGYTLPRAAIEFRRMPEYDGPTGPFFETLPGPITDLDIINDYLSLVLARVMPYDINDVIRDDSIREMILNNSGGSDQDIINALTLTSDDFLKELKDMGRTPTFEKDDVVSTLNMNSLTKDEVVSVIEGRSTNGVQHRTHTFEPHTPVNDGEWNGGMHIDFWQGLDSFGYVLPSEVPHGTEDRYIVLPPYNSDNIPAYLFFYMGEGVVAKVKVWPGTDIGWEIGYPGYWPHTTINVNNYNVFAQNVGAHSEYYSWDNTNDPNFNQTVQAFLDHLEEANPGMNPNYNITLGRNPWIDPYRLQQSNAVNEFIVGEHSY